MRRSVLFLFTSLAVALAGFALLADRALVREAAASAELSSARIEQDARTAALSVRGALGQLEQDLLAGRNPAGVSQQSLVLAPEPSVSGGQPYRGRPRTELVGLLLSTKATPSGLPEAVVAAVALGSPASRREVTERLLNGQLPVRAEDLPSLAGVLGMEHDPRVADLQDRLRGAPDANELPEAPAFRRTLAGGEVEGWTRQAHASLRYRVPIQPLFEKAGVAERATVAARSGRVDTRGTSAVPDVGGFVLAMRPQAAPRGRLFAARGLLWLGVAACLGALLFVHRALVREARAVSREKAFVAGVTHELRTPVAAIRVLGEALAEGTGEPREYGALLAQESERLEGLVERVLAATRIDEAPRFAAVRPGELLDSAARLMRPRAERRGATLNVRGLEGLGDARWDADAVRRALLNLIDNAIKHGPPDGEVLAVAEADRDFVRLSVRDDGPGIARRDHRRIFGRFERGTTEAPGTGLGLYLVDQVARAHGGRVDLQGGDGRGCTFTLVLPRLPPASADLGPPPATP
jgi:anti-sigma regulatory factor (Ser/Thr protein kinase)